MSLFRDPTPDEKFYARALMILAGPSRGMAMLMRVCNLGYWLSVIAALGWLAAQAIDRRPPIVVRAATVLTPRVSPGEPIRVLYDVTRIRTCQTDYTWSLFDGAQEIHRFGPVHVEAPGAPGPDRFVHGWSTPTDAAPGEGRLRVVLAFECPGNYLQALYPVTLILPDLPVEIAGRE